MMLFTAALLFILPAGLDDGDVVDLGDAAHFYGLEVPEEAARGGTFEVTVHYRTDIALESDVHVFLHVQSQESACRMVRDESPSADDDGWIAHRFTLEVPDNPACAPQRMEIYTGLYNRRDGQRFRVKGMATADDRMHAGYFDIVDGDTSTTPRALTPSSMRHQKTMSLARPFRWWALGLLASILLTLGLAHWMKKSEKSDE